MTKCHLHGCSSALVMTQEASGLLLPSKHAKPNTGSMQSQRNEPQHISSSWSSGGQGARSCLCPEPHAQHYCLLPFGATMPSGHSSLPSHPPPFISGSDVCTVMLQRTSVAVWCRESESIAALARIPWSSLRWGMRWEAVRETVFTPEVLPQVNAGYRHTQQMSVAITKYLRLDNQ